MTRNNTADIFYDLTEELAEELKELMKTVEELSKSLRNFEKETVDIIEKEPLPRPCKNIGKSITKPLYLENIKDHRINKKYKKYKRMNTKISRK